MAHRASCGAGRAPIDIWVGTSLGILKGVSLSSKQCTNFLPGSLTLSQTDKSREVCVMCWEDRSKERLYAGLRSGKVLCFSCSERTFTASCDCTGGEGTLVGLGKHEDTLISCTDKGNLSFWPPGTEKAECFVGTHVARMAVNPEELIQVGTGGKENDLKLWDGNRLDAGPTFQAKNVRHDSLDLRVPVWVTEVGFTPASGAQPTVAVGTGYHQVRLYDTRAQRRPIYCTEFGDVPVTALTILEDGRSFVVGNSIGELARFDLRKGSILNHYKGFAGGVRSLQCYSDGTQSLLAACGLDRYLRVFALHPPRLLHQVYLKLQCNCLLFSNEQSQQLSSTGAQPLIGQKHLHTPPSPSEESSDEELWAAMETVEEENTGRHRRKRIKKVKGFKEDLRLEAEKRTRRTK